MNWYRYAYNGLTCAALHRTLMGFHQCSFWYPGRVGGLVAMLLVFTACHSSPSKIPTTTVMSDQQLMRLSETVAINPIRFEGDPYQKFVDPSDTKLKTNAKSVCGIRYVDQARLTYSLATYSSPEDASSKGAIITHGTACGTCSTLKDLAAYFHHPDLTRPVRRCAMLGLVKPLAMHCIEDLGFTQACAETWYYNAKHTASVCGAKCVKSWLSGEPLNKPDGQLNACLACDEEFSGPVFKFVAGRTRRNSGLLSAIKRPAAEQFKIEHDY